MHLPIGAPSVSPRGKKIKLVVIDNFSGISALAVSLAQLSDRFDVKTIYTSEVDPYAMSVARKQIKILLPDADHVELSAVENVTPKFLRERIREMRRDEDLHILVSGGSPCQDL